MKPEHQWQDTIAYIFVATGAFFGFLYSLIVGDMSTVVICLFLVTCTMALLRGKK